MGRPLPSVLVAETRGKVAPAWGNGWSGQREILNPHHVGLTFQVSRAKVGRSPAMEIIGIVAYRTKKHRR